MKYRAKITNCISHIKNVKKYATSYVLRDTNDFYIDADTEQEAELIEELNYTMGKAVRIYTELLNLTSNNDELC